MLRVACSEPEGFRKLVGWYAGDASPAGLSAPVPATPSAAEILVDLLSAAGTANGVATSALEVEGPDLIEGSQEDFPGRLADPEQRSAIERRAVSLAKIHDEGLGFDVVEKGKPFDLLCMPGSRCAEGARVIHVEAKGTTSSGSFVHLTRNEVADAREAGKSWRSEACAHRVSWRTLSPRTFAPPH